MTKKLQKKTAKSKNKGTKKKRLIELNARAEALRISLAALAKGWEEEAGQTTAYWECMRMWAHAQELAVELRVRLAQNLT